jgi:RNA polymerase sigma-70 factor (ECF subfamily)
MPQPAAVLRDQQLSDEEIVGRVVSGDPALFEILMRRHNQRIYRAIRAILRSDDEVEDVMQQAYLNAYRNLGQFAGGAQFSTWLTRIAVNEALHRRPRKESEFEAMIELAQSTAPDPEQEASVSELRAVMEREISALPDSFRAVVVLRDVEGLSTSETADCLDISEDLVKTRLHRARTLLRDRLLRSAGVTVQSLYPFGNERCDRVVAMVMAQIA